MTSIETLQNTNKPDTDTHRSGLMQRLLNNFTWGDFVIMIFLIALIFLILFPFW